MDEPVDERVPESRPALAYERHFVPAIGAPLARELVRCAALRPGERVLDVACGTGIVARLASREVGATGSVAGLDVNPAMLAVARSAAPTDAAIEWHAADAAAMPLPDASVDAVLCQMGLQFMPDRRAALREMRRLLRRGGRLLLNLPGPTPRVFAILGEALARRVGGDAARFVDQVFSLHDAPTVETLLQEAGYDEVVVRSDLRTLRLPAPEEFLWQYAHATPLSGLVSRVDAATRSSLERDVIARWQPLTEGRELVLEVRVTTVTGRR